MVELTVHRVAFDTQSNQAIVILSDPAGQRFLPIVVGPAEGTAIVMAVEGVEAPRPQTHDLLKLILDRLGVTVTGVLIDDMRDDTFLAQIAMRSGEALIEIDARPSDAIAVALRFKAPIRALAKVLDVAGVTPDEGQVH